VVGRDAEPHEPPRRRQPLEHVDLDVARLEQVVGGVEARRARADDGDAQRGSISEDAGLVAAAGARRGGALGDLEAVAAAARPDAFGLSILNPDSWQRLDEVDRARP
jgi:hypothetical protein